jgi:hypothetical protein
VKYNGRVYEAIVAYREHRPRQALFHAALTVAVDGATYAIESAPSPDDDLHARGAVVTGPVGSRHLGRFRLFRYEVRCWRGGSIPDLRYAAATQRLTEDETQARALIAAVPHTPRLTWGRDERRTGDMWNSNSVVAWLLAQAGIDTTAVAPPGRAPGWPTRRDRTSVQIV